MVSQGVKVKTLFWVIVLGLSLFSFPLFSVWKKSKSAANLREIAVLQEKQRKAKNINLTLRCKLTALRTRQHIETVAKREMGLAYPKIEDILVVRRKRVDSPLTVWRSVGKAKSFFPKMFSKGRDAEAKS